MAAAAGGALCQICREITLKYFLFSLFIVNVKKICRIELVDDTPIRMFKPIYKTNSVSTKVWIQIIKKKI